MKTLSVYTDAYSIFDIRRALLTKMGLEFNPNFSWESFRPVIENRRYEYFNHPELGIIHSDYVERLNNLSTDDWGVIDENGKDQIFILPSKLLRNIFNIVRHSEFGIYQTVMVSKFKLTVNIFPFEFTEEQQTNLLSFIKGHWAYPVDVELVNIPNDELDYSSFNMFDYVFRYYTLLNHFAEKFHKTIKVNNRHEVKLVVPDLLTETPCINPEKDLPDEMKGESVAEIITKYSVLSGGVLNFLPIDKGYFGS